MSFLPSGFRPTWLEIDLDFIAHNIQQFKELLNTVKIAAVVKADGYGHGAVEVSRAALNAGASPWRSATFLKKGLNFAKYRIDAPILLLGYTDPTQVPSLAIII